MTFAIPMRKLCTPVHAGDAEPKSKENLMNLSSSLEFWFPAVAQLAERTIVPIFGNCAQSASSKASGKLRN